MNKEEYERVKDNYTSNDNIPFICPYCNKTAFTTKYRIQRKLKRAPDSLICCSARCSFKHKNPWSEKECKECGKVFSKKPSEIAVSLFCSRSCSASFNNRGSTRTDESKRKVSNSLKNYYYSTGIAVEAISEQSKECKCCSVLFAPRQSNQLYCSVACRESTKKRTPKLKISTKVHNTYIKFQRCKGCSGWALLVPSKRKQSVYCSSSCSKINKSKQQSERLSKAENRTNYGRGKKSYLEKSFEEWLNIFGIKFEMEVRIKNTELNKNYFVDFLFKDINLVIELDGTQHEKTKEQDKIRDEYIERVMGYNVVRIKHREYLKKTRYDELCSVLGFCDVEWNNLKKENKCK